MLGRRVAVWLIIFFTVQIVSFFCVTAHLDLLVVLLMCGLYLAAGIFLFKSVLEMIEQNAREQALCDLQQMELEQLAEIVRQDPKTWKETAVDEPASHCANKVADAVLFQKCRQLKERGIKADVAASLPEPLNIDSADLMSLITNLLDNAMEAAAQCDEDNRKIKFEITVKRNQLLCTCENTTINKERPVKGTSTKTGDHGHGLAIVEAICEKNAGFLTTSISDGWCQTTACMTIREG